jgi:hypothetical protein
MPIARADLDRKKLSQEVIFDGTQSVETVALDDTISHTIYKTIQVPSTCYKDVLTGYEQKCETVYEDVCHTEYENECHTEYQQQCHSEQEYVCHTEYENECHTEYQQQCHTEYENECTWVDHQQCHTEYQQQCHQTPHQVCQTEYEHQCHEEFTTQCHTVQQCNSLPPPQQVCWEKEVCTQVPIGAKCVDVPVQKCHTEYENECHSVPTQVCHNVPEQQCHQVPHQVCNQEPHQVCNSVPKQKCGYETTQKCEQIPHQVCENVPHQVCHQEPHEKCHQEPVYESQPYSCVKEEQVPDGEEIDFLVNAEVTLNFSSVPEGFRPNEIFSVSLANGKVAVKLVKASAGLPIYVRERSQTLQTVKPDQGPQSPGVKRINAIFDITIAKPADVVSPIKGGLADVGLTASPDALSFTLGKVLYKDLLGGRVTVKRKKDGSGPLLADGDFVATELSLSELGNGRTIVTLPLQKLLGTSKLEKHKDYQVRLIVRSGGQKEGLLNPQALGGLGNQTETTVGVTTP